MRLRVTALALVGAAILQAGSAEAAVTATPSPSPPAPSPAPSATASPTPQPSALPSPARGPGAARDAALAELEARIGADLTSALGRQLELSDSLAASTRQEQELTSRVMAAEDRIAQLQAQIAELDQRADATQARIDVERAQVSALARALARRPTSLPLAFARARNLGEALRVGTDLLVAGGRAHVLQAGLEEDLRQQQADRAARQADLAEQAALKESLEGQLAALRAVLPRQEALALALDGLLAQFQDALGGLPGRPAEASRKLVELLEQQQRNINEAARAQAWSAANVGAGAVQLLETLPSRPDLRMRSPLEGSVLSQGFGPTDLWFEPPLGPYPHFHTGVDLAAPEGAPVQAAADGVVLAVGRTVGGYGNYVVIGHGGGVQTLYGHLSGQAVAVGQAMRAGDVIGTEGSTGFSTGPHLHFEIRVGDAVVDPAGYIPLSRAA